MPECRICASEFESFISFGRMPIANGFLTPEQFEDEYFFELKAGFCPGCSMVQLVELVDPARMFNDQYPFFSSSSRSMAVHFEEWAGRVMSDFLAADNPFVVELGSNDGILLRHFAARRIRHLGIEPSASVARVAREQGICTISEFFSQDLAEQIVRDHGQADAILGANVVCHIPDLNSMAAGIRILLKPTGVFMFEDPYLGDIVEKTAYDQIYDEHVFYFSLTAVTSLLRRHGLQVVDAVSQTVHGGSMRYFVCHSGTRAPSGAVGRILEQEQRRGLDRRDTFHRFHDRVDHSRDSLVALLNELRRKGKRIVGYAATSKSTTVINYCGLDAELIEFISDTTPVKQGKFSPGAHIPIRPPETFVPYPDYALLFGWNHRDEIMARERHFHEAGGRWILYVPDVHVI